MILQVITVLCFVKDFIVVDVVCIIIIMTISYNLRYYTFS